MSKQNITLSLPKEVLREVKLLAVEKGTSVSRLLAEFVQRMLLDDQEYSRAAERIRRRLKKGFDLGTQAQSTWSREELHGR